MKVWLAGSATFHFNQKQKNRTQQTGMLKRKDQAQVTS